MIFNPPHPGEVIKIDYLEPLALSVTQLAEGLKVSRKNLSEIINGHTGISPEMAIRLSKVFDTTPELWLNLQRNYDLWHAQQRGNIQEITQFYSGPPRGQEKV